jgi:hypothetical protein
MAAIGSVFAGTHSMVITVVAVVAAIALAAMVLLARR